MRMQAYARPEIPTSAVGKRASVGLVHRPGKTLEFLVFEDNGGRYRWTIVSASGEPLAQSPGFASYEDARRAADSVRKGAGSAWLEPLEAAGPVDLAARRAERSLDEGGAYTAAVAVAVALPLPR